MKTLIDKKTLIIVIIIEVMALILGIIDIKEKSGFSGSLTRPAVGESEATIDMKVESEMGKEKISISVLPLFRSKKEKENLLMGAKKEVDQTILGDNTDLSNITDNLYLAAKYQGGAVKASWSFDNYNVIDPRGRPILENIKGDTPVQVSCKLECEDLTDIYSFNILVKKPSTKSKNGYEYLLKKSLEEANTNSFGNKLILPKKVENIELNWKLNKSNRGMQMALIGVVAGLSLIWSKKNKEKSEQKKLKKLLDIDYPDIVSMLSLYVSAGINTKMAFQRIGDDYKKRLELGGEIRPGFETVLEMLRQMEDGYGEIETYKLLGRRIKHKDYRRLSIILAQNVKKGSLRLVEQLEKEERHTFEERKLRAKIAGEEASTKLLLPMMGLLGIVLIVLIYPAISGIVI